MDLPQKKYNELSARIDAGEFLVDLPASGSGALPPLPCSANDEMKAFYANCQKTLELNLQKMKAMEAKLKAVEEAMKAKDFTSIASDLITDFNEEMELEFHDYKQKAEEAMLNLKDALNEARKNSTETLERNKALTEELNDAKARLLQLGNSSKGRAAMDVSAARAVSKAVPLFSHDDKADECKKAQENIAAHIIASGVSYASDIKKVTENESFLCIKLLNYMVNDSIRGKLDNDIAADLSTLILGIVDNRDEAKSQQEKDTQAGKVIQVSNGGVYNENVSNQNLVDSKAGEDILKKELEDKNHEWK